MDYVYFMLTFVTALSCRSSAPPAPELPPAPVIVSAPVDEASTKAPTPTLLRQPQDVSLFVLAEADTREAAEVALAEVSQVLDAIVWMSPPDEGYPRVVDSDELKSVQRSSDAVAAGAGSATPPLATAPSTSPHKYLVVAGACTGETFSAQRPTSQDPTEVFAAFFPRSYVLSASWASTTRPQMAASTTTSTGPRTLCYATMPVG